MVATSSGLSCALRMMMVKVMVAVAMTEVGLVLLNLEEGISGEKGREMVGVEKYWPTAISCATSVS